MLATPYGAPSHPEATPGCREGVQRRAVTTTGHGSLHPVRALLGQPRARSEGPLRAVRMVPEILIVSDTGAAPAASVTQMCKIRTRRAAGSRNEAEAKKQKQRSRSKEEFFVGTAKPGSRQTRKPS